MKKYILLLAIMPVFAAGYAQKLELADAANSFYSDAYQQAPPSVETIRCVLKGEVLNRPYSNRLILSKINEDLRTAKVEYIPIIDGKFEHVINSNYEELYELTFYDEYLQASWRPIKFFCEADTLRFTLYPPDEYEKNIIDGGKLIAAYFAFEGKLKDEVKARTDMIRSKMNALHNADKYLSAEAAALTKKLEKAEAEERDHLYKELDKLRDEGKDLTPEAQQLKESADSTGKMLNDKRLDYVEQNPDVAGYAILTDMMFWETNSPRGHADAQRMIKIYNSVYAPKYPDHPYTGKMRDLIAGMSVKIGNRYIDVTAIDATGKTVKLSEQIDGKFALIYLWASWCGPCRRTGKALIPVYEAYKDKGFTVVGIAREQNLDDMTRVVAQDGHPWLSLVEINDRENIWNKYGLGNAGGGDFLVDSKGVILAVNPTADEVKQTIMNYEL
ncbi:MAG: TlpA family protein disulfide reductase [Prevotellaceae bacterium]|nr:TlpA family protein disulfide reductase [Prevotellaceae bacterium]